MLATEPCCCLNTLLIRRHAQSRARMSDKAITMTGTQNAFSPFVMVKLCKWSYQDRKHEPQASVWVKLVLLATNWKSTILYISGTAINWSFPVSRMSHSHRHRAPTSEPTFSKQLVQKTSSPMAEQQPAPQALRRLWPICKLATRWSDLVPHQTSEH